MKSNKRVWESPVVGVQVFVPQDCVAACSQISNVYLDLNGNRRYDRSIGEHVQDYLGANYNLGEGHYDNIGAYSRGTNNESYNARYLITTYSVVDVRYEPSPRSGRMHYYAYNATS